MHTLNRQRANIVFSTLVDKDIVLTPEQAAQQERIFEKDGVLRWRASAILGYCKIGVPLKALLQSLGRQETSSGSFRQLDPEISDLMDLYQQEQYVLWYDSEQHRAFIALKDGATSTSQLKGWCHALRVAREAKSSDDEGEVAILSRKATSAESSSNKNRQVVNLLRRTLVDHSKNFEAYLERLKATGWDLDTAALETKPGYRFASVDG
jgi:hypothetical protein